MVSVLLGVLSLNVMIFKTADHAGLVAELPTYVKKNGAIGVELQDKQRTQ